MKFRVVIPARHGASRLPGKPLRLIAGKPMIWHVCQRARESGADEVIVATDHDVVAETVSGFGGDVCMTDPGHQSGSDRIAEVARQRSWKGDSIIVNLQGDEPVMPPANIKRVAENLHQQKAARIATLCTNVGTAEEILDTSIVKVVRDCHEHAMYFSRAPIPYYRDGGFSVDAGMPAGIWLRHMGLYAYRVDALLEFTALSVAEPERQESLEQLRALWHGMKIHVGDALELPGPGVDTEADIARAEAALAAEQD